ncbi:cytochrome b [Qipengyuania sp. ASV99]|uniref:cytochrome b n=1 Tax=Qipengyuania sp. ASV99 TaxID=3399681 RepID=UPI003A4C6F11
MVQKYTMIARFLHWIMAALLIVQIALGVAADRTQPDTARSLLDAHVQLGLTLLALVILRLLWRATHTPPALPTALAQPHRAAAKVTHWALYALMVVMPVSGYLLWMWIGRDLDFIGTVQIPLPDLSDQDEFWRSLAGYTHEFAGYALFALIALHIGAASWHEWVRGDRLIRDRMV